LPDPEPVKAKFESLIYAKLREAGFTVIPSAEYAAVWKEMTRKVGALFDPATGRRDERKFNIVREYTARELAAKTKADALLDSAIAGVNADFEGNLASWHGASEYVVPDGVWGGFFGPQYYGRVNALSLLVVLSDFHGRELYENAGGIEVLSMFNRDRQVVSVPRDELFIHEERNRHAVNVALGPLMGTSRPATDVSSPQQNTR
jgi:hypothetical protein